MRTTLWVVNPLLLSVCDVKLTARFYYKEIMTKDEKWAVILIFGGRATLTTKGLEKNNGGRFVKSAKTEKMTGG